MNGKAGCQVPDVERVDVKGARPIILWPLSEISRRKNRSGGSLWIGKLTDGQREVRNELPDRGRPPTFHTHIHTYTRARARIHKSIIARGCRRSAKEEGKLPRSVPVPHWTRASPAEFFRISLPVPLSEPPTMARSAIREGFPQPYVISYIS